MREDSAHRHCRLEGICSEAFTDREPEFDEYDGYSPIARLERRCLLGLHHPAEAVRRSTSMWGTGEEYQHVEARLGTRCSSTDLAGDVQYRQVPADSRPKRNSCSDVDTTIFSEMIAESKGSIGDRYVLLPGCNPASLLFKPLALPAVLSMSFALEMQFHRWRNRGCSLFS